MTGQPLGAPVTNIFARAYHSVDQSLPNAILTNILLDSETDDTTNMHDGTATAVALTGTVAKTNGSAAIVGTGTSFLTQLFLGALVTVPGGANETKVVTLITDDTHATFDSNFANTSSGQTATINKSGLFPITTDGVYLYGATVQFDASGTGFRRASLRKNGGGGPVVADWIISAVPTAATFTTIAPMGLVKCVAGDVLGVFAYQNSGGALSSKANPVAAVTWHGPG